MRRLLSPWLVVLVGLALAAPALTADFTADDHLQRVIARAEPGIAGLRSRPLDLFVFVHGNPTETAQLRDAGLYPWWTDPHLKLSFFRPLTSVTHALDRALWPDCAAAQLAHNLAWLALALAMTWLFYRRFVQPRWIAVLALALYAFDDARGPVVGWIANRNGLIALALAVPALLAHDRWRRHQWAPGRWLGPAAFALSLGAGESSLAIAAYLCSHALWLDRGPWRSRLVALAPYLAIVVAWRLVYGYLGYGVAGSGIYLDPGSDPAGFASVAPVRITFLLLGQLALPWSDLASFYPILGASVPMLAFAAVTLAVIGLACARLLRRDPTSRFFATGMVLAAVPIAGTFAADRLLGFVGLGAMGLVAQLLGAALRHRDQLGDGRARRIAAVAIAVVLALVHLVLSPPLLVLRSRSMVAVGRVIDRADAGVPSDASIAGKTVVIVAAPSDALAGFIQIMRASRHQPAPAHLYWLATATTAVTLERVDDHTLRVTPTHGLLRYEIDRMMRTKPFAVGDRVALPGLEITVEAVTGGRPTQFVARFAVPLEDSTLVWRRWRGHTYVPYQPPQIGTRDEFPAVDFLKLLDD